MRYSNRKLLIEKGPDFPVRTLLIERKISAFKELRIVSNKIKDNLESMFKTIRDI